MKNGRRSFSNGAIRSIVQLNSSNRAVFALTTFIRFYAWAINTISNVRNGFVYIYYSIVECIVVLMCSKNMCHLWSFFHKSNGWRERESAHFVCWFQFSDRLILTRQIRHRNSKQIVSSSSHFIRLIFNLCWKDTDQLAGRTVSKYKLIQS